MSTQNSDYDFDPQGFTKNPWLARTLGREMFYLGLDPQTKGKLADKLDGLPRCFVLRRPEPASIYGGVEFWMQVGMRADGTVLGVPFYSNAAVQNWTYKDKKGNVRIGINPKFLPKNDPLADLVGRRPDLIAPEYYDGKMTLWASGDPKRNYAEVFAVEAYEVVFETKEIDDPKKPGKKKSVYVNGADGTAKYVINPTPYILKLRRPWWAMLRDRVLVPKSEAETAEQTVTAPDGSETTVVRRKWSGKLPSKDVSQVLLMLFARTGLEPAKGPANVEYSIQFSEKMLLDSKAVKPVDELPSRADGSVDWHQIFTPMTENQARDILAKADEAPEAGDQGAAPAPNPEDAPPASDDSDIPF